MRKAALKTDPPDRESPRTSERQEEQARWRVENSAYIAAYNQVVEEEGLPFELVEEPNVDLAWAAEIEHRCEAIDSGSTQLFDWEEVSQRIERELLGK